MERLRLKAMIIDKKTDYAIVLADRKERNWSQGKDVETEVTKKEMQE